MKCNTFLCLSVLSLLLIACNTQGAENADKNEVILEEQTEKWEVTDILGNKVILDVNNVPEMDDEVRMVSTEYPDNYAQVYDGHYYYMEYKDNLYTIYMDHGTKVGSFERCADVFRLQKCVKYGGDFYVIYSGRFGEIDFKNQKIKRLFKIDVGSSGASICHNQLFLPDFDGYTGIYSCDFQGNYNKKFKPPHMPEEYKYWYGAKVPIAIDKKNIYYNMIDPEGKKVQVIYVNQNTGEMGQVFEYTRDVQSEYVGSKFSLNRIAKYDDTIYIEETVRDYSHCLYIIDGKRKKMQKVTSSIKDWTISEQYVFYTDQKDTIHRWDKETEEDKVISKIKAYDIKWVGDELYVQEYNDYYDVDEEEIEITVDSGMDYSADEFYKMLEAGKMDIYTMDFDGGNIKKIGL